MFIFAKHKKQINYQLSSKINGTQIKYMAKNKTNYTEEKVEHFLDHFVHNEQKRKDSEQLIEIMEELTGLKAKMWGSSIIGFGNYSYTYASGHSGEAPLMGFSPRKTAISLYIFTGIEEHKFILEDLGKFKMGKACIYINKLEDININALKKIMNYTLHFLKTTYTTH